MQPKKKKTSKDTSALPSPFAALGKSLLYMYVEDFLGFHQQSFNFAMAPRFQMLVRGEERILQRAEPLTQLEDYWENHSFFGKNITALSLLIGENGSGKTTVFRLLFSWLRVLANGKLPTLRGALVFRETRENNQHEYSYVCFPAGTGIDVPQQFSMKKMEAEDARRFLSDVSFTYYTDTMTDLEPLDQDLIPEEEESEGQFIDRSLNARLCEIPIHPGKKHLSRYELRRLDFAFQVEHLLRQTQPGEDARVIPIDYLRISCPSDFKRTLLCKLIKELQSGEQAGLADFESLYGTAESCFQAWKNLADAAGEQQAVQLAFIEGTLWSFVTLVLQSIGGTTEETIRTLFAGLFRINIALIREAGSEKHNAETLKVLQTEVQDYIGNVAGSIIAEKDVLHQHAIYLMELCSVSGWVGNVEWEQANYLGWNGIIAWIAKVFDITEKEEILKLFKEFVYVFRMIPYMNDYFKLEWHSPSSGEDNSGNLLAVLTSLASDKRNRWVYLDEPDNAFHPDWKQKLIRRIQQYCLSQQEASFQLWISSHSPILLSDFPAQAVVLLKREERVIRKLNVTEDKHLYPFAQQIYTLFDDGFFLEKGVVGSFAGETIHALNEALQEIEQSRATTKKSLAPRLEKIRPLLAQVQEPVLRGYLVNRFRFCEAKIKSLK